MKSQRQAKIMEIISTTNVETQEQLDILRENGCEIAQGFLFDKPLPVKEFEQRMDRHIYPKA